MPDSNQTIIDRVRSGTGTTAMEYTEYRVDVLALCNLAEQVEQRNVELVAALKFWRDLRNESKGLAYYHLNGEVAYWGEFYDPTDAAIARAESATPAKHCEDCAPEFGCWDGGESCYKQPLQSSTPAKQEVKP